MTKNDHGNLNEFGKVKVTETPKYRILVKATLTVTVTGTHPLSVTVTVPVTVTLTVTFLSITCKINLDQGLTRFGNIWQNRARFNLALSS